MQNLVRQIVGIGLISIGQTFAVLIGGVDLSVGSVVTLVAVFGASFMNGRTELMIPVTLFCLALGAVAGWLNGLTVVRLRVPAFIATLGTLTIGSGIALAYTPIPIGRIATPFRFLAGGQLGPVPFPLALFVVAMVLSSVLLRRTPLGCRIRAVGGDPEIARLSGIRVRSVQMICYVLCGLIAAVGGLYYLSRMGVGDPSVGSAMGFDSLTAVVLGGCSLAGGVGSVEGALGGVLVVALLNNILNLLNVNPWYQQILKGLIILLAVTLYREKK
jgi:ribose/xylose/arabinose/galactoside ABC-type transport system permease subunit